MDKSPKLFLHYEPMLRYLEEETGYKFKYVFSPSYQDLLIDFENEKIDIVELGPLPFLKLYAQYKDAKPFLTFKSKDYKTIDKLRIKVEEITKTQKGNLRNSEYLKIIMKDYTHFTQDM